PDMHRITVPTLILTGMHDELTPNCAMAMQRVLPNAQLRIFKNSSHMPFWEEPAEYFPVLLKFLDAHRSLRGRAQKRSPGWAAPFRPSLLSFVIPAKAGIQGN